MGVGTPVLEIECRGYRARRIKDIGEDQKLNGRRSLGEQTTSGTDKIQEAERERKLDIATELEKSFDLAHLNNQNN